MKVDLDTLNFHSSRELLHYCDKHAIDQARVQEILTFWADPLLLANDTSHWIIDIPQEHVNWLALKGWL